MAKIIEDKSPDNCTCSDEDGFSPLGEKVSSAESERTSAKFPGKEMVGSYLFNDRIHFVPVGLCKSPISLAVVDCLPSKKSSCKDFFACAPSGAGGEGEGKEC